MTVQTMTHLNFRGQSRQALEHYHSVLGGDLIAFAFGEAQDPADTVDGADPAQLKWGQVEAPNGFRVMAYDVPAQRPARGRGRPSTAPPGRSRARRRRHRSVAALDAGVLRRFRRAPR